MVNLHSGVESFSTVMQLCENIPGYGAFAAVILEAMKPLDEVIEPITNELVEIDKITDPLGV